MGVTDEQRERWTTVLGHLTGALPDGDGTVVVGGGAAEPLAGRLAERLRDLGRDGVAVVAGAPDEEPGWRLTVWARTARGTEGDGADAIVDLHDPGWPVLRHLDARLAPRDPWHATESRAFFAVRAAGWDTKFGDDRPAYAAAVAEAGLSPGGVAVDVGCGTGRALPVLREALGAGGRVIGADHTPQMLAVARERALGCDARLVLADARCLPFGDASVDVVFAAGLVHHLPDPGAGLAELARITRDGGRLVVFQPTGRAALAARHGRSLRPDEPLAEPVLRATAGRAGWRLTAYDDPPHRFHALAVRESR
jgi:SAM-dependent methyltransferase